MRRTSDQGVKLHADGTRLGKAVIGMRHPMPVKGEAKPRGRSSNREGPGLTKLDYAGLWRITSMPDLVDECRRVEQQAPRKGKTPRATWR